MVLDLHLPQKYFKSEVLIMEKGISFGKMEVKHITVQTTFPYNKEVYTSQLLQKRLEFT